MLGGAVPRLPYPGSAQGGYVCSSARGDSLAFCPPQAKKPGPCCTPCSAAPGVKPKGASAAAAVSPATARECLRIQGRPERLRVGVLLKTEAGRTDHRAAAGEIWVPGWWQPTAGPLVTYSKPWPLRGPILLPRPLPTSFRPPLPDTVLQARIVGVSIRHLRRLCLVSGVLVGLLQRHSLSSGSISARLFVVLVCLV